MVMRHEKWIYRFKDIGMYVHGRHRKQRRHMPHVTTGALRSLPSVALSSSAAIAVYLKLN